jgi:hypothetical protein
MEDGDGQPSWLSGKASQQAVSSVTSQQMGTDTSGSKTGEVADTGPKPAHHAAVVWTFIVISMGAMVFLAATGALGVMSANNIDSTGTVFVGLYLLVFSAIEFTWEVAQLMPVDNHLDAAMKKNFGFLYGTVGRGMFFVM